jgi:hypothetical protein
MSAARGIFSFLALGFLLCLPAHADNSKVKFFTVTGRAAILDGDLVEEARNRALEDALYNAALAGGAKIDGFSSVQADSRLDDHFIVRPSSQILDYNILDQTYDDISYQVTIEAAVGAPDKGKCQNRNRVNITVFAPASRSEYGVPAWAVNLSAALVRQLNKQIAEIPEFLMDNQTGVAFNRAKLSKDARYDYAALTGPAPMIRDGDFSIVTGITFKKIFQNSSLTQNRVTNAEIRTEIFVGRDFKPVGVVTNSDSFVSERVSFAGLLTGLSNNLKSVSEKKLSDLVKSHFGEIKSVLLCTPFEMALRLIDKELRVPVGQRQGLKQNQLLIADGNSSPWSVLRVSRVNNDYSVVVPLNSRVSASSMDGKAARLLEVN